LILFKEDAPALLCGLHHFVTVRRFVFDFHGELGDWLFSAGGDFFGFSFQQENVSRFRGCVAAADSAFNAFETCGLWIVEFHVSSPFTAISQ
jgi:hypothetical protein